MASQYDIELQRRQAERGIMRPFRILIGFMIAQTVLLFIAYEYLTLLGLRPYVNHLAEGASTGWEGLIILYYIFASAIAAIPFAILCFVGRKKCADIEDAKSPVSVVFKLWGFIATCILGIIVPILAFFLDDRSAAQMGFVADVAAIAPFVAILLYCVSPRTGQVSDGVISATRVALTICGVIYAIVPVATILLMIVGWGTFRPILKIKTAEIYPKTTKTAKKCKNLQKNPCIGFEFALILEQFLIKFVCEPLILVDKLREIKKFPFFSSHQIYLLTIWLDNNRKF